VRFGDTEGDPHKGWPADPKAYYLYFPDDATFGKENVGELEGAWLRGAARAEIILRALEPVRRINATVIGGPSGDTVELRCGASRAQASVGPGARTLVQLEPPAPFVYKDSFVFVLVARSARGGTTVSDARSLGSFVSFVLDVAPRSR
jgi:hypothetical protein